MKKVPIHNFPDYAWNHRIVVCRDVDGEKWFWGAYDDLVEAGETAGKIQGMCVLIENVESV